MREHLQLSYGVYEQAMPRGRSSGIDGQPPAWDAPHDAGRLGPRLR
jgi:hypothetical protein